METAPASTVVADDERAIRNVVSTWMEATAHGDTQTLLDLMADDVVFLVPGQRPFGKAAFAAAQQNQNQVRFEGRSQVREIHITGDWAYCWTDLLVVATPLDGGAPVRRSGNTLSIFRRLENGRWVLARDANLLAPEKSGEADRVA